MFIHGWSQSRVVWEEQVREFAGFRKRITYDLRGHGDSARPREKSAYMGEWTPGKDMEAILAAFGVEEAILVGWSFGAIVAANSAVYLGPERVRGLVLVSGSIESGTPGNFENFGPLFRELGPMTQAGTLDEEKKVVHRFLSGSYLAGNWPPELYGKVFDANMRLTPLQRFTVASRPMQSFAEGINKIGIPVTLIHGEQDPVFLAESSRQAHAKLQNSSLHIYEDTGHWPFLEQSMRFNRDIREFAD